MKIRPMMKSPQYAIAITGASGVIYGIRLVEVLVEKKIPLYLTGSASGAVLLKEEMGLELGRREAWEDGLTKYLGDSTKRLIHYLDDRDLAAPISSGSHPLKAVAIVPCSM